MAPSPATPTTSTTPATRSRGCSSAGSSATSRTCSPRPSRSRCSTSAAARASSRSAGRGRLRRGASSASTSTTRCSRPSGQRRAAPNLTYIAQRAEQLPFGDGEFDVVTAIEVLEHVPDPAHTLAEMARCAARHVLVSVPREPLWRAVNMARGAYWRQLGNTPGHVNHFSSPGDRRALRPQRRRDRDARAVSLDDGACPRLSAARWASPKRSPG